ncbi:MAG: hypothetical protein GF392_00375 [Candidatus Omnitrophica bacterium]|nr:hypothetical protein [Candidatus Omnitrophota bacterium]
MWKITAGAAAGALTGFGANYLCKLTGGACPLMSNMIMSVIIWALLGAAVGATLHAGRFK